MIRRLRQLFSRKRPVTPADWSTDHIDNEDFRAHFLYAADIVAEWLGSVAPLERCRLMDFGCGDGSTPLALALRYRLAEVHGVDLHDAPKHLPRRAREQLDLPRLPGNLHFHQVEPGEALSERFTVDAIMSWSVFEHVDRDLLPGIFRDLHALLPPGGHFFIQIDPLYYSPPGSHLEAFIKQPWVHLLHSDEEVERALMAVRAEDVHGVAEDMAFQLQEFNEFKQFLLGEFRSLNRITADEVVQLGTSAGFEVVREERNEASLEPPEELLARYDRRDLVTREIRVLFRR